MKISYNWLKDFLPLEDLSPQEIAEILTLKVCEVEKVEEPYPYLKDYLVVEIKEVKKHPEREKLFVCEVTTGKESIEVVSGARNIQKGAKYPWIPPGKKLPNGKEIGIRNFAGVSSYGMLLSAKELDLEELFPEEKEDELLLLEDAPLGESLHKFLWEEDFVLEIDNKSITHRPDLWSHFGFARELSALLERKLKKNPWEERFPEEDTSFSSLSIEIQENSALAYAGAVIEGFQVKPSPLWIRKRLLLGGMRPINNVVDASNYVLLEIGQPTHAFDREKLKEEKIVVSFSKEGERIRTLDQKDRILPQGIVVIRDGKKPVAIGGIIGGEETEVKESTRVIFLESATFYRPHIRKGISLLKLRTEASQRFEKGQTPDLVLPGIYRFAHILKESSPSIKLGKISSVFLEKPKKNYIQTSYHYFEERLGIPIEKSTIASILTRLNMKVKEKGDSSIEVEVPSYRSYYDIEIPEDLVEEVGRILGYEKIQEKAPLGEISPPSYKNHLRDLEHFLREFFSKTLQFFEVYNYPFIGEKEISLDTRFSSSAIKLKNPPWQEKPFLRNSPLAPLLRNIEENVKKEKELFFYEIERIFIPQKNSLPKERYFIAGVLFRRSKDKLSLLEGLKSALFSLLEELSLSFSEISLSRYQEKIFHPYRAGSISSLFRYGEIHPYITHEIYKIRDRVYYFEAFLEDLLPFFLRRKKYSPPLAYPLYDFELTLLMPKYQEFIHLQKTIQEIAKEIAPPGISLYHFWVKSVYEGDPIPKDKKAISLYFSWRHPYRTITHEEARTLIDTLVARLREKGYPLRM